MTAIVTVTYSQGDTFTDNNATIKVGNGGKVALDINNALGMNGTFSFSEFSVSSGGISFYNGSTGTPVSGSVTIPISSGGHGNPTITVSNFSGTAQANWPSTSGPKQEPLSPGNELTLTDFTG
ncbi:hypothetical protein [Sphingomonas sp. DT-204]|uniref:hypothetical protein n=1 Tax=Sphingomonas sp. DT-204 TaxID=3396166 RepID=UPI003F19DE0F